MTGHDARERPDIRNAGLAAAPRSPELGRAFAASDLACDELSREVALLDRERGGAGTPAAAVQRLVLRGLPDVCGLLAPHLRDMSSEETKQALIHLFTRTPFDDRRMESWSERLRTHLGAYTQSLTRWADWNPCLHDLAGSDHEGSVRWVSAWERPEDGAVAADFVGYVNAPADLASPDLDFAMFVRDAHAILEWLEGEYGPRFTGLRLWIVGNDGRPVVRWLRPE